MKERFWGGGTHGLRAVRLAVLVMAAGMSLVPLGSVGPAFATALTSPTSAAHLPRTPPTTTAPLAPDIKEGPDAVQLLSQTPWAGPEQASFQLELQITASDPGAESLGVFVYGALTARSEFQAALGGQVSNFLYAPSTGPVPLRSLVRGPGGGAEVDIPLSTLSLTTGVYPVQVFLEKDGIRVGQPLTTFLVFAGKDAVHLKALRASFVLPIAAEVSVDPRTGATAPLPSQEAQALQAASAVLAAARAPVTLAADVPTLEALQRSGYTGQDALADLRAAVKAGDELLPSTAMPVEIPSFVASGLTGDLEGELQEGSKDLVTLLGAAPTMSTWAFPAGTGLATVEALATLGARQVALPGSALSPLPASYQVLTFARPTRLKTRGMGVAVVAADPELSARASDPGGDQVLVANQVLAELAMIDLEAPNDLRGVVVLPTGGNALAPTFLSVLFLGLQGDPLVDATTLADELATVPPVALVRSIEGPSEGPELGGTGQLQDALSQISADAEVYGDSSLLVRPLSSRLLVSLSSAFSAKQRGSLIASVASDARAELSKLRLPPPASITLTSHDGRLPLAILSSSTEPATVRLVLSSAELSFRAQKLGSGSCTPVSPGSESCLLTLTKTTTLQVPVAVRTSGVFQLSLSLETPSGGLQLAVSTDTVRSTATNEVALALMAGALLFLGVWWVRNARHGHRARRLIPKPADDDGLVEASGP